MKTKVINILFILTLIICMLVGCGAGKVRTEEFLKDLAKGLEARWEKSEEITEEMTDLEALDIFDAMLWAELEKIEEYEEKEFSDEEFGSMAKKYIHAIQTASNAADYKEDIVTYMTYMYQGLEVADTQLKEIASKYDLKRYISEEYIHNYEKIVNEEILEEGEVIEATVEGNESEVSDNSGLTFDLRTDIANGLLNSDGNGHIVDNNGNIIPEYSYIEITENGSLFDGDCILEGYSVARNGQLECYIPVEVEYDEFKTPLEKLREKASLDNCATAVLKDDAWDEEMFGDSVYSMDDDGSYFDEVVLGVWFNSDGTPKAGRMPSKVGLALAEHPGNATNGLKFFHFIDGETFTMDMLKRASVNIDATYAMVLTNISKQDDGMGNVYMIGYDYISVTPVVIHGNFSGILNGDDILVFAEYTGLASDDTPNFNGVYVEIINDRGLI